MSQDIAIEEFSNSYIQYVNWLLYKLNPTGLTDKVSVSILIKSSLNIQIVKNTLQALTQRHSILRSIYYEQDEKIIQEIRDTLKINFENIDASSWSDERLERQLLHWEKHPFNLESGGVFRACLFSRSVTEHIFLLTIHQIAGDWESLLILVEDFVNIYESTINAVKRSSTGGNLPNLSSLNISYTDYIQAELSFINSESGKQALNYWLQLLNSELPVLELPTNSPRPTIRTYNGASIEFCIKPQLSQQIKQLALTQGVTVEEILLAVFKVLLYRYTGEEDILVGLLLNRENKPLFKGVIGNLTNVTVVRDSICGNLKFTEFLSKVSKTLFEIDNYKDYPFSLLVKQIKSSDLSHPPICQAAFSYSKQEKQLEATELDLEYYQLPQQKVDFDLSLEVTQLEESLFARFKYNSDVLEAATVTQIAEHYQNLLAAIVENPQTTVGKLPMLGEEEKHQILVKWNDTRQDYDLSHCLHQLFEAQVEKTPETVAVVFEEQELTYRQLNSRANKLAHYLQKLGVKAETKVGICVERSLEMMIGLLGIQKAGGAYVPIDPGYPSERIDYMLADSEVSVLLTQNKLVSRLELDSSLPKQKIICLDTDWGEISQEDRNNIDSMVTPDNLAYIIYTSGSTGKPKGVQIYHRSLTNFLKSMSQAPGITNEDTLLAVTTICFDIAALELYLPLIVGAKVAIVSREVASDAWQLLSALKNSDATVMQATPATWQILLTAGWKDNSHPSPKMKVLCGGEALPAALANQLLELGVILWNMYGPTETTIWSSVYNVTPSGDSNVSASGLVNDTLLPKSIGKPIANTQIYILDSYLQPVAVGVRGEIYIGGVGVAKGYLNRPELTAEKFIPNPFDGDDSKLYKTGDLGRYLSDGNIEYLARADNQVKIRGFRIETGEIEATLTQHPYIKEAVTIATAARGGEKRLVAYVVPEKGSDNQDLFNNQVNSWQDIFDQKIESQDNELSDRLFNTGVWYSSYNNQPIAQTQMRLWADDIIEQILANQPQQVWEIGCGTGMLLFPIAARTKTYYGTDISKASLDYIREQIAASPEKYEHVTLAQKPADEFDRIPENTFDVLILNSIVQYFPSIEYLQQVICGSIRAVKPGGMIFLGDIRSKALMRTFHTSIQEYLAEPSLSTEQLRQRIEMQILKEKELLIAPEFFVALKETYPQISHVQIRLQRGSEHNELNKFRYHVLLHIDATTESIIPESVVNGFSMNYEDIRQYLHKEQPNSVCFSNLHNARLATDTDIVRLLEKPDIENVEQLRQQLHQNQTDAINPETLHQLGGELGYQLELCWSLNESNDRLDAVFVKPTVAKPRIVLTPFTQKSVKISNLQEYGNNPLNSQIARSIIPQLKQHLKQKLAEYMIPSAFVILSQLPLTPNGKVNRRALPAPDISSFTTSDNFVAPRDRIEEQLAEIWSEILGINPVGVKDNFFELGGHSLLAISLMAKIQRSFDKQLPLSTLLTNRTIEDLASLIGEEKQQKTSSLVPIQTQGNKQPFFCVHAAGGHVLCYQELSHALGNNQPFYGIQAQGFNQGEKVFTKVEDMAEFYVQTIQEFQPKGPLQIGGWSFGGVVAFEMAQQLVQQGREVSLLAILDAWVPILLDPNKKIDNPYLTGALSRYFGGAFGRVNLVSEDELAGLNPEEKIEFIIEKAEKLGLFPPEASREQNRRFIDVIVGTLKATYVYKRRPYPGKVTVFRPRERHYHAPDPQLVWVELYAILDAADLELNLVPGNHFNFLQEPNIKVLAERLSSSLI
ncbi:MAG: amino acid adenylation domain-containing protein [Cyanobacteria bacterium P01_D01_bin.50]